MILAYPVVITVGEYRDDACQELRRDLWWEIFC
jgi:hypothetical protein